MNDKGLIITIVATVILLVGGIFLFSKKSDTPATSKKVSDALLMPADSYKTSTGSAEINLVEFGDYQCPACGVYHPFVKKLLEESAGKVNFVFRHFPLSQHKNAPMASYAVLSAGKQNKYWQMHDKMFETQAEWSDLADPSSKFVEYAKNLNLDTDKFTKDINSKEIKEKVSADMNDGTVVGINATPTYYANGVKLELPSSFEEFKNLVLNAK